MGQNNNKYKNISVNRSLTARAIEVERFLVDLSMSESPFMDERDTFDVGFGIGDVSLCLIIHVQFAYSSA